MQVFQLVTLLAAAAVVVLADGPHVETPTSAAIAGIPLQVKWDGGQGPFTVVVNTFEDGKQTGVIKTESNAQSPLTFKPPSSAVGKPIQFDVTDSTGALGQSGATKAVVAGSGGSSGGDSSGSSSGGSSSSNTSGGGAAAGSSTSAAEASSDSSKSGSSKDGSKDASKSGSGSKSSGATSIRGTTASVAALTAGAAAVAAAALL